MKKVLNIKIFFFFLPLFILIVNSKEIIEINLNQIKRGSLKKDEYDFYKITLPENINKNSQLIFELEPNTVLDLINNIVSDPNLYVSIDEINPTFLKHKWCSNRLGDETITLGGEYINPFQYFHIGVHCKEKCNYILKISLIDSINIQENKINSYTLEEKAVMKFSFTTRKEFKELSLYIFGSYLNSFNTYLSENNPSSYNTLPAEPILFNGYKYIIKNNINKNENFKYDLIVDNNGQKQELNIWLKYDNENVKIKEAEIVYDAISEKKASCFYFAIDKIKQNKDLIISTTLFNGFGFIYIHGFNSIDAEKINLSYKKKDNSYSIINNKVIHLTKNNFKKYGEYKDDEDTNLNFCFYAEKKTSLSIRIHLLENFKIIQTLNYIYPGIRIEDLLPKKSLTRYKMENFDINNDLYLYLNQKTGKPKLYLYMANPERNNDLLDYDNFQPYKKEDQVLEAQDYFNSYYLSLTKELNKCKKYEYLNTYSCYLNAIVECDSEEDCTYELFFDHSKSVKVMEANQIYTNVISENEFDPYFIRISDIGIKNIAIVLTPITGRTSLQFMYFQNETFLFDKNYTLENNGFSPGLITISAKSFNLTNLIGNIKIKVEGLSYASYSIYYYTFNEEENEEYLDQDKISMKLEKGTVIKDIFMDNHKFKIYMYDSSNNINKTDLFVTLIETNMINSELYIFKDLNDFSIIDDRIYGYLWKGDYNDYIYIDKNDKNYIENDVLYILIYKKEKYLINEYATFYLGITDENTPFLLNEGIDFRHEFNSKHNSQKFYYLYIDNEEDLKISFSLYWGRIFVKIKILDTLYTSVNIIDDNYLITIRRFKLKQLCLEKTKCPIYIEVENDIEYFYYSSFLLAVKSTSNNPIYLKQGFVNKRNILSGEDEHFIIDLKPDKSFGAKISAYFSKGQGELYARKLLKSELYNITNFPDEQNYEYKVTYPTNKGDFYIIEIPYEEISNCDPCTILLTVKGVFPGFFDTTKIEYSLSISNNLNELITDKNYKLFISQGEIAFFHFKVGNNKKRLYISMTNKDKDANLFLNYEAYLNTISEYRWENIGGYNEYLDISLDDPFFAERQMEDIDGDYYLAIQALDDSFYNLYISTQDVKMLTLKKGSSAGCTCERKNDFCYFRYEIINDPSIRDTKEQKMIFYTEFTYGTGTLFGKLYSNGDMEQIMKNLPSLNDCDFIENDYSKELLHINLNKRNPKYTYSSVIVVGVQCKKKSLFDMSTALLDQWADMTRNDQNFLFLEINRDNIFYLSQDSGKSNKFVYYIYQEEDFNFQIKALTGSAKVHVYTNSSLIYSKFNENENENKKNDNNYHHISDFEIDSYSINKKDKNNIYYGNVPKRYGNGNYIFIDVKPIEDCLININVNFDLDFSFIPLNKEVFGLMKSYDYYGYFDLSKNTDEFIITVTSMTKNKNFNVYIKTNIIDLNEKSKSKINDQYKYSKPNLQNYDIKGSTNSLTSAVSLRINNVAKKIRKKSIVRVLINVESDYYVYNEKIKILVTPVLNNTNRIRPEQHVYYFSSMKRKIFDKTLYMLRNTNNEDDLMIIEISACKGNFIYSLVDSPPLETETYNQLQKRRIKSHIYSSNGKKIITVTDLEIKEYYLVVFGADNKKDVDSFLDEKDKEEKNNNNKKGENFEMLFYYYTTNTRSYNYLVTPDTLFYENNKNNIKFKLPELKKRDAFGRENYVDYINYTFIVSENKKDFIYMESTCYLIKLIENKERNNEYKYIKTNYDKENNNFNVKGLKNGKTYYMNILAKNEHTGEIITFKPVMIEISISFRYAKFFSIIILLLLFLFFLYYAFRVYRKYRIAESKINNFEVNKNPKDSLMKKFGNITNINLNVAKKKYNSLSEDSKSLNDY